MWDDFFDVVPQKMLKFSNSPKKKVKKDKQQPNGATINNHFEDGGGTNHNKKVLIGAKRRTQGSREKAKPQ